MSRSGYSDDVNNWDLIRWRGSVTSATRGKRGQAMLKDLLVALDAMPDKRLAYGTLVAADNGGFCTLGVALKARGIDPEPIDAMFSEDEGTYATETAAAALDIAAPLAKEIAYLNDDDWYDYGTSNETPEHRWMRMRDWVVSQITP